MRHTKEIIHKPRIRHRVIWSEKDICSKIRARFGLWHTTEIKLRYQFSEECAGELQIEATWEDSE